MSQVSWIDALRQYNAGMPSWCIPRKGTPGYEMIGRMRRGEPTETPKELMDKLERKTAGRPKKIVKRVLISLDKDTDVAKVPTLDDAAKTDRPSTKKMSVSNNKMAVVPVNYVAEGGSPKKQSMKEKIKEAGRLGAIEAKRRKKALDTDLGKKLTQELAELEPKLRSYTNELARLHRKLGTPLDDAEDKSRYHALKATFIPDHKNKINRIKHQLEALVKAETPKKA